MDEQSLIDMLDSMMDSGVSRLKVEMDENQDEGTVTKKSHHGRCDVGSPFATGKLFDFDSNCD